MLQVNAVNDLKTIVNIVSSNFIDIRISVLFAHGRLFERGVYTDFLQIRVCANSRGDLSR